MASISLQLTGEVNVDEKMNPDHGCIGFTLESYLDVPYEHNEPIIYQRDWVTLHGTPEQVRAFAEALLRALPVEAEVQEAMAGQA